MFREEVAIDTYSFDQYVQRNSCNTSGEHTKKRKRSHTSRNVKTKKTRSVVISVRIEKITFLLNFFYLVLMRQGRFLPSGKKSLFIPGCVQGAIIQLVCLCLYVYHSPFLLIARAVRRRFPQTRDLWKRASMGKRVGRISSRAVSRWSRSPGCCGFRGVFSVGRIFQCSFFFVFFSSNAHGLLQV